MKRALAIAILFLLSGQLFAQKIKSNPEKMNTSKEHYTFQLSDKVTRQKVSFKTVMASRFRAIYTFQKMQETKNYQQ